MQFGGPETRTRCVQEMKTKGIPDCRVRNWQVRCEDTWIITCTGWATDFMQHEIFLVASGPEVDAALRSVVEDALLRSLAAAAAAAAATPGEAAIKSAAAVAAFKTVLFASLSGDAALIAVRDKYNISLDERSHW